MKKLSRVLAAVIAVLMIAVCFAGCHEKDEIAYTIGDHTYTAAMYSCVLYVSAGSARNAIDTYVSENGGDTENVKYSSYKFNAEGEVAEDGTVSYNTYVKDEAVKLLKQYSIVMDKMAAAGIEMDEETVNSAKVQASYYWYAGCDYDTYNQYTNSYGVDPTMFFTPYSEYFEPNGVALSTYEQYMVYEYMYNFYFEHLYGEGGEKEVPKDELTKYLTEHYTIADVISFSKLDEDQKELAAEELTKLKEQADGYAARINSGEAFDVVYKEYEASLSEGEEGSDSSDTADDTTPEDGTATDDTTSADGEEEYTPEAFTVLYGDEDTEYNDPLYDDISGTTVGQAVVIDDTNSYVLAVKRDITEKSYWLDNLRSSILLELRQDEYDASLDEAAAALTVTEDTHATAPFGVKDIKFQ